jgi:hypothetical protein
VAAAAAGGSGGAALYLSAWDALPVHGGGGGGAAAPAQPRLQYMLNPLSATAAFLHSPGAALRSASAGGSGSGRGGGGGAGAAAAALPQSPSAVEAYLAAEGATGLP